MPVTNPPIQEVTLVSNVRSLCDRRKWQLKDFVAACIQTNTCGIDTAKKLYKGSTNVQARTAAGLAVNVFGVKLWKVFDIASNN